MKKIFQLTAICLVLCALASCGKNPEEELLSIKIKTPEKVKYTSYQEACAVYDFQAAHQYLAKMKNIVATYEVKYAQKINNQRRETKERKRYDTMCSIYSEAKTYVYEKEYLYLYSLGKDEAKQRILYLLKEEGEVSSRIDMLLNLAIESDDVEFVKTLAKQDQLSSNSLQKIVKFLYLERGSEHLDYLTTLLNSKNQTNILLTIAIEKDDEELVKAMLNEYSGTLGFNQFKQIINYLTLKKSVDTNRFFEELALKTNASNSAMLDYAIQQKHIAVVQKLLDKDRNEISGRVETLASLNDKKISDLIIAFSTTLVSVPQQPKLGTYTTGDDNRITANIDAYQESVQRYNSKCLDCINIAIAANNRYMAKRVKESMKSNVHYNEYYKRIQNVYTGFVTVTLDNTDILEAEKRINRIK